MFSREFPSEIACFLLQLLDAFSFNSFRKAVDGQYRSVATLLLIYLTRSAKKFHNFERRWTMLVVIYFSQKACAINWRIEGEAMSQLSIFFVSQCQKVLRKFRFKNITFSCQKENRKVNLWCSESFETESGDEENFLKFIFCQKKLIEQNCSIMQNFSVSSCWKLLILAYRKELSGYVCPNCFWWKTFRYT